VLGAQGAQLFVQVHQAVVNELHPPILPGQSIQNFAVKHEHAPHVVGAAQRVVQGGVVAGTQITAKPH
jgi:hypothetical protein